MKTSNRICIHVTPDLFFASLVVSVAVSAPIVRCSGRWFYKLVEPVFLVSDDGYRYNARNVVFEETHDSGRVNDYSRPL
jgi:hypothetical protein